MMFAEVPWQTVVAIAVGVAIMILVLWIGLRNRKGDGAEPSAASPPNLVSRIVSWTSMIHRGSYRGETKSLHRTGGSVNVLIATAERPDSPVNSWVLERSINAMTLVAQEPFEAGTLAKVRPLNASAEIPWVDINVNECTQLGTEWRIACRFVKVPPYNILMLFG